MQKIPGDAIVHLSTFVQESCWWDAAVTVSTQCRTAEEMIHICARIISYQKIYVFYGLKHHIEEISGDVTHAGQTNK